jgi:glutamyl-tRNA reductase
VSHHGAPLELLERLSIPAETLPAALSPFAIRDADGPRLCEGVLLSTCNRTEIYAAPRVPVRADPALPRLRGLPRGIVEMLCRRSGQSADELAARLYRFDGWAAADHLFRVVCGLDSLVVGESQIRGQVARAYAAAQAAGTAGVVLSTLFQEALRGGRRARARIGIGRSASNVGSIAVRHAERYAGPLSAARVVVVGTGEIGRIVLESLRERGVRRIEIVSRSAERAAAAAGRRGCNAHDLAALPGLLDSCDALVSTTRASVPLLGAAQVDAAMKRREGRRLVLIDIAVPRTIDPRARGIGGVTLLDIDSFKTEREASPRSPEILRAEGLIEEELAVLKVKMTELALRPVIGGLWRKAASIRGEVLQRTRAQMPHLDEQSWSLVEDLASSLVARLLHEPATRLRAEAGNGHAAAFAQALRELFGVAE